MYHIIYIIDTLQNYLFPHVGSTFIKKARFLGYMVKQTLDVYLNYKKPTDRDSYIYKRVDLSGFLVGTIFRDLYFRYVNHIEKQINIGYVNIKNNNNLNLSDIINQTNIYNIFDSSWINDGFRFAFIANMDGSLNFGLIYLSVLSVIIWIVSYYLYN